MPRTISRKYLVAVNTAAQQLYRHDLMDRPGTPAGRISKALGDCQVLVSLQSPQAHHTSIDLPRLNLAQQRKLLGNLVKLTGLIPMAQAPQPHAYAVLLADTTQKAPRPLDKRTAQQYLADLLKKIAQGHDAPKHTVSLSFNP